MPSPHPVPGVAAPTDATASQPGTSGISVAPATAASPQSTHPVLAGRDAAPSAPLMAHAMQAPIARPQAPSATGTAASAVLALVLVIGLILVLAKLVKRIPGFNPATGSSQGGMRLVSSLSVGTRDRLVVVATGQQQWLVGIGEGGPRLLSELAQPLQDVAPAASATAALPAFAGNFAQVLSHHFKRA